ncbi:MAG: hypothetical protein IT561_19985, partial [Alphaproteobacteria bacterium]|nr:hypothetical protein [Alphaproteobacteria bacterium]
MTDPIAAAGRARRRLFRGGALVALLALAPAPASAAQRSPALLLDPAMAALVGSTTLPGMADRPWIVVPGAEIPEAACRDGAAAGAWIGLTATAGWRVRRASCLNSPRVEHARLAVGREAAILVTRRGGATPALDRRQVFRAVAAGTTRANPARRWRDLARDLPDADIRLLLPAAGTPLWRVFSETVLEPGCLAGPARRRTFDPAERMERCTVLRGDGRAIRRSDDVDPVAWLAAAGDGAVAVLSYGELLQAGEAVAVVPIEGERPTFAALSSGAYPASRTVYLTFGLLWSGNGGRTPRPAAVAAAMAVVAEDSIGPAGALTARGLV